MNYVIVTKHKYGESYWNGGGFGCFMKSVKYKTKSLAAKAVVEEAKKWMFSNKDVLVYYPNYGLPYVEKIT